MTFSQYRVYLILFVLMVSSWMLADLYEEKEIKGFVAVDHSPDFFSTGYYKKEMTLLGVAKSKLIADKMVHYSDDGRTHLENPVMTLYNSDLPPWVITSEAGILEADGNHLLLTGKVFITREGTKQRKSFKINTSSLRVELSISYAETDQWAEIINGSNKTEGIGLEATFVDPIKLKFLSKVKGRYVLN